MGVPMTEILDCLETTSATMKVRPAERVSAALVKTKSSTTQLRDTLVALVRRSEPLGART